MTQKHEISAGGMMKNSARKCGFFLLVFVAVFVPSRVCFAEVYKWVDESGRVRFSDKAPGSEKADVTIQKYESAPQPVPDKQLQQARERLRAVQLLNPRPYAGKEPTRRVGLEKIIIDIPEQTLVKNAVIGQIYLLDRSASGAITCDEPKNMYMDSAKVLLDKSPLGENFHSMFRSFGYDAIDEEEAIFANQEVKLAEISVAGIIRSMDVRSCGANADVAEKTRTSTYMKVEWKVFDNLSRKTIYEATTEGADDGFDKEVRTRGNLASFTSAFVNAGQNLLADEKFSSLLRPTTSAYKSSALTDGKAMEALRIKLQPPVTGSAFSQRVKHLKRGAVTVRNPSGHGSGFLIADDLVLTNYHVVEGQSRVMILADQVELPGKVIRFDKARDVALVSIGKNALLQPLPISLVKPEIGEAVFIIGTPLDEQLGHTVSQGILSAERLFERQQYFQTDAAVNHGNSGGPAFDSQGNVIGMAVAASFSRDGGSLNIGYLIPIADALSALRIEKL